MNYQDNYLEEDFLGKAAVAKQEAKQSVKDKEFNVAWQLYHEQKSLYLKHASKFNFTKRQTLALDASVSEYLANILRLEKKHDDALVHIIYWVACSQKRTKSQKNKLTSYFNRAKFKGIRMEELNRFVGQVKKNPDFRSIQKEISEWRTDSDLSQAMD